MQPSYLVDAYSIPVLVKVSGKANYMNCNSFREFMERMRDNGKREFVIDFEACTGMDSTFLGILAGNAIDLRKADPPGDLRLVRLGKRNGELIRNLGLHNLLSIDDDYGGGARAGGGDALTGLDDAPLKDAGKMLEAHERLVEADEENVARFQDVIAFLRNQVEEDRR